jgi:hypothetical protein
MSVKVFPDILLLTNDDQHDVVPMIHHDATPNRHPAWSIELRDARMSPSTFRVFQRHFTSARAGQLRAFQYRNRKLRPCTGHVLISAMQPYIEHGHDVLVTATLYGIGDPPQALLDDCPDQMMTTG